MNIQILLIAVLAVAMQVRAGACVANKMRWAMVCPPSSKAHRVLPVRDIRAPRALQAVRLLRLTSCRKWCAKRRTGRCIWWLQCREQGPEQDHTGHGVGQQGHVERSRLVKGPQPVVQQGYGLDSQCR